MRLKADSIVQAALDSAIARESQWVRKGSTVVRSEKHFQSAISMNCPGRAIAFNQINTLNKHNKATVSKIKSHVKISVRTEYKKSQVHHLQTLMKQGEFIKLACEEKKDADWNSFIYNLPKGTMKFILNSTIHTLPTQNNLKLWGKRTSDKCKLCGTHGFYTSCSKWM